MRTCEITNQVLTHEGFVIYDGEMYAATEEAAEQIAKDAGYESWAEMHAENPETCYWTEWDDCEDWYDGQFEEGVDYIPVYHDQLELDDDMITIYRFCPFRLVPSVMAMEFGDRMVSLGRWSSYCIPQLCTQPIQFILP